MLNSAVDVSIVRQPYDSLTRIHRRHRNSRAQATGAVALPPFVSPAIVPVFTTYFLRHLYEVLKPLLTLWLFLVESCQPNLVRGRCTR
eukprot:6180135-Pleurochrysis_carterae.AAC.3